MSYEATVMLIAEALLFLYLVFSVIQARRKHSRLGWIPIILMVLGVLLIMLVLYRGQELKGGDYVQILLMIGLVTITAVYASSTEKMANANVKMAEEMREQRIMASRPVIIQRAEQRKVAEGIIAKDYFSHFEVYNAGNGPAIELEISTLNADKHAVASQRRTFLRAGDSPLRFEPLGEATLHESACYLVSEYQSIFSQHQTWYQTWLPFEQIKAGKEGKIYVKPGELEFREISEKDRINAFSGSKPK